MPTIPFALSVQHFINSVGADAGFAAIIGLAILVLLYFAQARETASLRDQVEDSADLIQHLEHRLEQVGRTAGPAAPGTVTPAPAPAPAGVIRPVPPPAIAAARTGAGAPVFARRPSPVPVAAGAPAAPAGVGAPALSAATRLIPADPSPIAISANGGERTAAPVPAGGAAVMSSPGPPPATAAGGANGGSTRVPPVTAASAGTAGVQVPPRPPARADGPAGRAPTGSPRRPAALPLRSPISRRRSPFSRVAIAMVTLLGVVAVVIVLLIVTSSGGSNPATKAGASSSGSATSASTASHHRSGRRTTAAAVTPASVTVAVLNGTGTPNLAKSIAGRLVAAGFKQGTVTNASDQTQTATVIGYLAHHQAAALLVARSLKLGPASVQAVDQSNEAVACQASSSTPCTAQVVVTVGSDLASNT